MPNRVLNYETPLNMFKKCFPNSILLSTLPFKVFGCTAFVHFKGSSKLNPRAEKYVFIVYPSGKKGYKCYNLAIRKVFVSMDDTFLESQKIFLQG